MKYLGGIMEETIDTRETREEKETKEIYEKVGNIAENIALLGEFNYRGEVYISPGAQRHIERKHGQVLGRAIIENITQYITEIIEQPEYVGRHPNKQGTSLELVRKIDKNVLVAIEVDLKENYIYVASMYPITAGKLANRMNSGRFKKVNISYTQ